jgi:hypothetical protein
MPPTDKSIFRPEQRPKLPNCQNLTAHSRFRPAGNRAGAGCPGSGANPHLSAANASCDRPAWPDQTAAWPWHPARSAVASDLTMAPGVFAPNGAKGCSHGWSDAALWRRGTRGERRYCSLAPAGAKEPREVGTRRAERLLRPSGAGREEAGFHGFRGVATATPLHPWLHPNAPSGRKARRSHARWSPARASKYLFRLYVAKHAQPRAAVPHDKPCVTT